MTGDFREILGTEPGGVWAAPGRVNLIGEHTDYNDGFALPFALPQRTTVAARRADGPQWTVRSTLTGESVTFGPGELVPGKVTGWAGYVAGVVWALAETGLPVPGATMLVDSDVPRGAGLSSSAALECAVLTALVDLGDLPVPPARRPALARHAENDYVGMPCGIMDQSASVLCQAGSALFLDCRSGHTEQVPFDLARYGMKMLVIDTRVEHRHVAGEYADRRAACERAAAHLGLPALRDITDPRPGPDGERPPAMGLDAALDRLPDEVIQRRVRHVVTENERVLQTVDLLRAGRVAEIGPLLTASHCSLRDDFEVTTPELDLAVTVAIDAGAYGARMTGGGFGGCVLALVDAGDADHVAAAVTTAFETAGFGAPVPFVAEAAAGAGRVTAPDA